MMVFAGAGLGANLRFWIGKWMPPVAGQVPWNILIVNVTACFVIGVFTRFWARGNWSEDWRTLVAIGICGGYSTLAAVTIDTVQLYDSGHWRAALLNLTLNTFLPLATCAIGFLLGRGAARA